jgi:hypothetical protein
VEQQTTTENKENKQDELPEEKELQPDMVEQLPEREQLPEEKELQPDMVEQLPEREQLPEEKELLPEREQLPEEEELLPEREQLPEEKELLPEREQLPEETELLPGREQLPKEEEQQPEVEEEMDLIKDVGDMHVRGPSAFSSGDLFVSHGEIIPINTSGCAAPALGKIAPIENA